MKRCWMRFCQVLNPIRFWPLPLRITWCNLWAFYPTSGVEGPRYGLEVTYRFQVLFTTWR